MDASPKLKRLTIGLDGRTIDSNWWVFSAILPLDRLCCDRSHFERR